MRVDSWSVVHCKYDDNDDCFWLTIHDHQLGAKVVDVDRSHSARNRSALSRSYSSRFDCSIRLDIVMDVGAVVATVAAALAHNDDDGFEVAICDVAATSKVAVGVGSGAFHALNRSWSSCFMTVVETKKASSSLIVLHSYHHLCNTIILSPPTVVVVVVNPR